MLSSFKKSADKYLSNAFPNASLLRNCLATLGGNLNTVLTNCLRIIVGRCSEKETAVLPPFSVTDATHPPTQEKNYPSTPSGYFPDIFWNISDTLEKIWQFRQKAPP